MVSIGVLVDCRCYCGLHWGTTGLGTYNMVTIEVIIFVLLGRLLFITLRAQSLSVCNLFVWQNLDLTGWLLFLRAV